MLEQKIAEAIELMNLSKGQLISKQNCRAKTSPKKQHKIARISALPLRAEILAIFRSFFGRSFGFINSF